MQDQHIKKTQLKMQIHKDGRMFSCDRIEKVNAFSPSNAKNGNWTQHIFSYYHTVLVISILSKVIQTSQNHKGILATCQSRVVCTMWQQSLHIPL